MIKSLLQPKRFCDLQLAHSNNQTSSHSFPWCFWRWNCAKWLNWSSSFLLPKDAQPFPLLPFLLLSHCIIYPYPFHYFSTLLQIHNKIILPSISVESFFCFSDYISSLLSYWLKLNIKFLQNPLRSSCTTEPFTGRAVEARHTCSTWHWAEKSHLFFYLDFTTCPSHCTQSHFTQMSSKNLLIHIKIATQPTCVLQQQLSLLIITLIFSLSAFCWTTKTLK